MGVRTATSIAWVVLLALGLGCSKGDTAAPLADGFYLQADRGLSIHVMQVRNGQRIVVNGRFERIEIEDANSLFRVTTDECGTIDFILKPGNKVECANCADVLGAATRSTCPFNGDLPVQGWEYVGN